MPRPVLLLIAFLTAGCETRHNPPAPPPQDSGANRPAETVRSVEERGEGRGHPDRLSAGLWRVVRGDTEVRVNYVAHFNGRCSVALEVRNRNKDKPLAFTNWTKPSHATLKDSEGLAYPLVALTAERERSVRDWEKGRPDPGYGSGAGAVTHARPRVTNLEFDAAALAGDYTDLDLEGGPVGFADPILFRIPSQMTAIPGAAR